MLDWFKRRRGQNNPALAAWRAAWVDAVEGRSTADVGDLRRQLGGAPAGEDLEVELEMLDALDQLRTIQARVAAGDLPVFETQHRVVATDPCHFLAPASLPGDAAQVSGRVLFTTARAIFVGGGRNTGTPWHAVHDVLRSERDLLLVRADESSAAHYRFNTYADAVIAAFLARHFRSRRARPSGTRP